MFWWISDYGSSTKRIIKVFFVLNGIFTLIYLCPVIDPTPLLGNTSGLLRGFMQTTLVPFSIIEIATKNISDLTMFFVMIHVILGYVILAALVTRIAVMFEDQGP
ncbi:MAG TPA: hypothetical protein O0X23_00985 [Methanocorpusculum sp.]|nr:hypothetical protein [Methanocorpusculum sp.]